MLGRLFIASICALSLSGCDQFRTQMAELIAPQSPEQALQAVHQLIKDGNYGKAKDEAIAHSKEPNAPLRGEFALAAARALALMGQVEAALEQLSIAVSTLDLSPDMAMNDPAFEGMQTDIRFLQIITEIKHTQRPDSLSEPAAKTPRVEGSAGDAQIRIDDKGIEARAGDVVVKLPN